MVCLIKEKEKVADTSDPSAESERGKEKVGAPFLNGKYSWLSEPGRQPGLEDKESRLLCQQP